MGRRQSRGCSEHVLPSSSVPCGLRGRCLFLARHRVSLSLLSGSENNNNGEQEEVQNSPATSPGSLLPLLACLTSLTVSVLARS